MTLAALALMRAMDTGLGIAGNLAFKTATTSTADVVADAGTAWLVKNGTPASTLNSSNAGVGYYGRWMQGCDISGNATSATTDDVQWNAAGAANPGCGIVAVDATTMAATLGTTALPAGYTATYVMTRMCTCAGPSAAPGAPVCNLTDYTDTGSAVNICAGVDSADRFHDTPDYAQRGQTGAEASSHATSSPYYRVIARVVGPRNTTSFVETVVTLQ
jgi:hypothetical protein